MVFRATLGLRALVIVKLVSTFMGLEFMVRALWVFGLSLLTKRDISFKGLPFLAKPPPNRIAQTRPH